MGFVKTRHGRANFGNMGTSDAGGSLDSQTEKTAPSTSSATPASGGLLNSIIGGVTGGTTGGAAGGVTGSMGSMCGCANADAAAAANKKAQLAQQYPQQSCGTPPNPACVASNAQMQALSDNEFTAWQKAQDAQTAASLSPTDKANFAAVNVAATKLLAMDPDSGNMTLSQIETTYPGDFAQVYSMLQAQFPFLQNVPAATALAMNPSMANMTLNQLIQRTATLSQGTIPTTPGQTGNALVGVGIIAAGALVVAKLMNR